jgi:hypothetical protein
MSNITSDQALANFAALHRQSRLLPEQHEALKESLQVLGSLVNPDNKTESKIAPDVALNNFFQLYTRANVTVDEHEALKSSFNVVAQLVQTAKQSEAPAS